MRKFSHEFDVHDVYKVGIKRFWAQEAEMVKTANSSLVSEKKVFREPYLHHVQKEGIKRFGAQEAKMSLTPISLLESAKKIFLMNSTYMMTVK